MQFNHGKSYDAVFNKVHPHGFRWLHETFGTNWRMTEIQASIGRIQLRKMPNWTKTRNNNQNAIWTRCKDIQSLRVPEFNEKSWEFYNAGNVHAAYKCYLFVKDEELKSGWSRDRIIQEINSRGVPCYSGSCSEVYLEKAFKRGNLAPKNSLVNAKELGETSLMFLIHPSLQKKETSTSSGIQDRLLPETTVGNVFVQNPRISTRGVNVFYGDKQALVDVTVDIAEKEVIAFIGPSGCGKSTLLRSLNRMNDTIDSCRLEGQVLLDEQDIYDASVDVVGLRARVGMVFQKANPFPKSIFENVAYGPKIHGLAENKADLNEIVESSLTRAGIWDELKDRLDQPGTGLSGGQQQRLCIARAIAVNPEVILMDEPCSALDPIATAKIEELIAELRSEYTIVIVTHSMQQAARVSDRTAYFHLGKLVEVGKTKELFINPAHELTQDYITGRFG